MYYLTVITRLARAPWQGVSTSQMTAKEIEGPQDEASTRLKDPPLPRKDFLCLPGNAALRKFRLQREPHVQHNDTSAYSDGNSCH